MKKYKANIRPLTAVHIGTGNVISPLEYTIHIDKNNNPIIIVFKPENVVELLSDEDLKEYYNIIDSNNFILLRFFLSKKAKSKNILYNCIKYTTIPSKEFKEQHDFKINDINNALEISENYKDANYNPVIPGSSIKGAIRTAILNGIIKQSNKDFSNQAYQSKNNDSNFQKEVLQFNDAKNDPFRILAIGDATFSAKNNITVSPLSLYHYHNNSDLTGINIFAESLRGLFTGSDITADFDIIIHDELLRLKNENFYINGNNIKSIDLIKTYINDFYLDCFNDEYNKIMAANNDLAKNIYDQIADYIDRHNSSEQIIRIGRWSQIESVTVEKYRRPFNKKGFGKTRTLMEYNGLLAPIGWCTISISQ